MTLSRIRKIIDHDEFGEIHSVEALLRHLEGPAWIFFPGINSDSCRLITTLLHGNEPSGCHAVFRLIKEKFVPAVDTWILIASVSTALTLPVFSMRTKEGLQDLNRCFRPPWESDIEKFAAQILHDIREFKPEAIVDVHNTSGAGPGFCVATSSSATTIKLAGIFSNSLVITNIKLGSLMELDINCPVLTAECGGNQSELSHLFAYNGIHKFLCEEQLSNIEDCKDLQYYHHPLRLELKKGYQLAYGDELQTNSDITLCNTIEEQNFGTTVPEKILGWIGDKGLECLQVLDTAEKDLVDDYFKITAGKLTTKIPLHLFMVTTNRIIAESDCIFYLSPAAL